MVELGKELIALGAKLIEECKRLDTISGLPAEFWDAYRLSFFEGEFVRFRNTVGTDALPLASRAYHQLLTDHSPRKVVDIYFTNIHFEMDEMVDTILGHYHGELASVRANEWLSIGPIDDFDGLKTLLQKYGMIVKADPARNSVELRVTHDFSGVKTRIEEMDKQFKDAVSGLTDRMRSDLNGSGLPGDPGSAGASNAPGAAGLRHAPGSIEALVATMKEDSLASRKAVQALLQVDVTQVTAEQRQLVAQALRTAALDERSSFELQPLVEGLVHWGGDYAAPVLAELLEKQSFDPPQLLWDFLAAHPTPEIAVCVARKLTVPFTQRSAYNCLDRMGPAAEDAMRAVVDSPDADLCLAGLQLLSKHGTSKSLPLLAQAQRSRNPNVREAAKKVAASIRRRETNKPATPSSDDMGRTQSPGRANGRIFPNEPNARLRVLVLGRLAGPHFDLQGAEHLRDGGFLLVDEQNVVEDDRAPLVARLQNEASRTQEQELENVVDFLVDAQVR